MKKSKLKLAALEVESFTTQNIRAGFRYAADEMTGNSQCTCPTGCTGGDCCGGGTIGGTVEEPVPTAKCI